MSVKTEDPKGHPYPGFSLVADIVCVCMAMAVLIVANRLNARDQIVGAAEHALNLIAILLFITPPLYMALKSNGSTFIKFCMITGATLLASHELVQIGNSLFPMMINMAILDLRPVMLGVGFCMFMISMYLALINMARTQIILYAERNLLAEEISERKRAEEEKAVLESQLWQAQKSESLDRMAGAIAHHFNNQLHAVIGNLDLALEQLPQDTASSYYLAEAMQASRRASSVSNLMLTYIGQTPSKREPLDLSETCRANLPILQSVVPKSVELITNLSVPDLIVNANENQIQQVLLNLLTNAWEAQDDGECTIRLSAMAASPSDISATHRFPIDARLQNKPYACLEVADSGSGIAAGKMGSLFDPFFSTKFTGRGMGLAVVLGIVRAHEGVIAVESEPGKGSVFRVYIPLTSEVVVRPPEQVAEPREILGSGVFLLVDDEEPIRKIGSLMLKHLGYTVLTAKDGVEAVEVFRQHEQEIRCVLCDLTMPRMDGWETLTALRQIAPGLPVIMATGYGADKLLAKDSAQMPNATLTKPYLLDELCEAVRKAL